MSAFNALQVTSPIQSALRLYNTVWNTQLAVDRSDRSHLRRKMHMDS